jgi:hypothetical protein
LTNKTKYGIIIPEREKEIKKMLWDELAQEQKETCYISYCWDLYFEYGEEAKPISFEEFDKDWTGFEYDV